MPHSSQRLRDEWVRHAYTIPVAAKILLSAIALLQAILMAAIELNRTHATNPMWPGHARFHLVWQNCTAILSAIAIATLIWTTDRFYLAATLTGLPLVAFLFANLARPLYGGTMSDPNGVPPLRIGSRQFDGNTLAVILGLLATLAAILLYRKT